MTARVLVVDDVEFNVKLLDVKLKREYYQVKTAGNGKEAIVAAKEFQPDIILMDVMMPEMDGFEATKIIKSDPELSHIPIIIVTALNAQDDKVRGLESGADDFLTKPINDVALMSRLKSLVRLKLMNDELRLRDQTSRQFGAAQPNLEKRNKVEGALVAIVDDDSSQIEKISVKLASAGINTDVYSSIEPLLEASHTKEYSLILVSTMLRANDGLQFSSVLRSADKFRHTPILIIVDESDEYTLLRGLELGVNDYILSPVEPNEMLARSVTQIRRKNYQDELKENYLASLQQSVTDALTGLYNRRYFESHIRTMLSNSNFTPSTLSVLMLDIDHFKKVNDTYGHQSGDVVIQEVANRLRQSLRLTDLSARYGGEEFVVILPSTDLELAYSVAERIRSSVEMISFNIPVDPRQINCTVSIGVSCLNVGDTLDSLVARADKALYKSKESGRNKVTKETEI